MCAPPEDDLEAHRFDANNLQTSHLNMSASNNMIGSVDVDTDDFNEVGTDFDGKYYKTSFVYFSKKRY